MWMLNRHITAPTGCSIKEIIVYPVVVVALSGADLI